MDDPLEIISENRLRSLEQLESEVISLYGSIQEFKDHHSWDLSKEGIKELIECDGLMELLEYGKIPEVQDAYLEELFNKAVESYNKIEEIQDQLLEYLE